jgi:hypothetical protein
MIHADTPARCKARARSVPAGGHVPRTGSPADRSRYGPNSARSIRRVLCKHFHYSGLASRSAAPAVPRSHRRRDGHRARTRSRSGTLPVRRRTRADHHRPDETRIIGVDEIGLIETLVRANVSVGWLQLHDRWVLPHRGTLQNVVHRQAVEERILRPVAAHAPLPVLDEEVLVR